jgi:2-succinyl-5-enolpyruvyl-6-hydroxy-3-cyclohexene-1-carboxylate synthase
LALLKHIFLLSEICSKQGMREVIICPGSRSAALTLAFNRNPEINTQVIADERSAGFVGLGISSLSYIPTGLVCTSGSAAYNFAPAIAEAFFQEIPLLIFTADRPAEWIHQYDGQTIFQENIFGKHVKKAFQLPSDYSHPDAIWQLERAINEAFAISMQEPKGPVHINVPIREPFYPEKGEEYVFDKEKIRIIKEVKVEKTIGAEAWKSIEDIWQNAKRPLIAIGQQSENLIELLTAFKDKAIVLADAISNLKGEDIIKNHDVFIGQISDYEPDILITFGKSFISKPFKKYIRGSKLVYHIHIQENPEFIDSFQKLSHKVQVSSRYFLQRLNAIELKIEKDKNFLDAWKAKDLLAQNHIRNSLGQSEWGQLQAIKIAIENFEGKIHVGNSMPVRYLNYLQNYISEKTIVLANRGTSGIDGIVSTAIGQAQESESEVLCVVGDVSFFYDSNALFVDKLPQNVSILLINNAGGNIFRQIDGPSNTPELESHFVGKQNRNAKSLCGEAQISYYPIHHSEALEISLKAASPKLIEVFVDAKTDVKILKDLVGKF